MRKSRAYKSMRPISGGALAAFIQAIILSGCFFGMNGVIAVVILTILLMLWD